jgi:hypothetical protein
MFEFEFWLLLYAHRHRSILGAAGHIILTPANQLMVMGLKIWSLFNSGFQPGTFRSLAQRAYHLCSPSPQISFLIFLRMLLEPYNARNHILNTGKRLYQLNILLYYYLFQFFFLVKRETTGSGAWFVYIFK